jgi:hypothetical protein
MCDGATRQPGLPDRHDLPLQPGPHLELGAQRHVVAELVRRARQPHLAAIPPVGQQHGEHVPSRPQQRRDVVRLVLHPCAVLGVAGGEFGVANARAVKERLVQAERGEVQAGRGERRNVDERPEPVGGAGALRWPFGLRHADPPSPPVLLAEQAGFEPDGVAPLALAGVGPHLDLRQDRPPRAVEDRQPDERLGRAVHPASVVAVVGAQPVGVLHRGAVRQPPAQGRLVPAPQGVPAGDLSPYPRGSAGHHAPPLLPRPVRPGVCDTAPRRGP